MARLSELPAEKDDSSETVSKALASAVASDDPARVLTEEAMNEDDEDDNAPTLELAEEVLSALIWTIPLSFLHLGLDVAVHKQYHELIKPAQCLAKLTTVSPIIFVLTFLVSRPPDSSPLPPLLLQFLLAALGSAAGITLVNTATRSAHFIVIDRAPPLATLWVWSAIKTDLAFVCVNVALVAASVWRNGQVDDVVWWRD